MCLDVVFKKITIKEMAFKVILHNKDIIGSKDIIRILGTDLR